MSAGRAIWQAWFARVARWPIYPYKVLSNGEILWCFPSGKPLPHVRDRHLAAMAKARAQ
jgi:hypothetical protein